MPSRDFENQIQELFVEGILAPRQSPQNWNELSNSVEIVKGCLTYPITRSQLMLKTPTGVADVTGSYTAFVTVADQLVVGMRGMQAAGADFFLFNRYRRGETTAPFTSWLSAVRNVGAVGMDFELAAIRALRVGSAMEGMDGALAAQIFAKRNDDTPAMRGQILLEHMQASSTEIAEKLNERGGVEGLTLGGDAEKLAAKLTDLIAVTAYKAFSRKPYDKNPAIRSDLFRDLTAIIAPVFPELANR